MEERMCPFCSRKLDMIHRVTYCDYSCSTQDHTFVERISDVKNDKGNFILDDNGKQVKELSMVKIRLSDHKGDKFYLKINYEEGKSQVWSKNNVSPRNTINSTLIPNYNNKLSIINKIKTLLLFS